MDQNNIFREDGYKDIPTSKKRRGNFCINNNLYDKYIECEFNQKKDFILHENYFSRFDQVWSHTIYLFVTNYYNSSLNFIL